MERLGIKRRLQGGHFVKQDTQRPNVRLEAVALTANNLRRKVVRCADYCFGSRLCVGQDSSDAEVTKFEDSALGHEDVLRLQVSVQNLFVVSVLYG